MGCMLLYVPHYSQFEYESILAIKLLMYVVGKIRPPLSFFPFLQ